MKSRRVKAFGATCFVGHILTAARLFSVGLIHRDECDPRGGGKRVVFFFFNRLGYLVWSIGSE